MFNCCFFVWFFFVSSFLESMPECSSCQFGVTACDHASVCGVSSSPRNTTLQGAFTCWRTTTCGGLPSGEPRSADCSAWSPSLGLPTNDGYGGPPGARTTNAVSGCSEPVSVVGEASGAGARGWRRVVNRCPDHCLGRGTESEVDSQGGSATTIESKKHADSRT